MSRKFRHPKCKRNRRELANSGRHRHRQTATTDTKRSRIKQKRKPTRLGQQLVPSVCGLLHDFRDAETEAAHEIVATSHIVIPDLNQHSSVLVLRLQGERDGLVPHRVQISLDDLRLLLHGRALVLRNQLNFHVRVAQAVRIHWNQVAGLLDTDDQFLAEKFDQLEFLLQLNCQ